MKKSVFLTTPPLLSLFIFSGCQSQAEPATNVDEDKHADVKLIIDIKILYRKTMSTNSKLCSLDPKNLHLIHQAPQPCTYKKGKCDIIKEETKVKKLVYLCGGHSSMRR